MKPASSWADTVDEEVEAGTHKLHQEVAAAPPSADFPSLAEAKNAPNPKPKAPKKGQKMSMAEFLGGTKAAAPVAARGFNEKAILLSLPTASRGRDGTEGQEQDAGRLGGAFKDYGGERSEWALGKPSAVDPGVQHGVFMHAFFGVRDDEAPNRR